MSSLAYTLPAPGRITHTAQNASLLRDGVEDLENELGIHVKSGDYFVTLATKLDLISQNLPVANEKENILLQQLVDDLLYLQQHYRIVEKTSHRFFPFT